MSSERVQLWHGPDVAEAAAAYTRAIAHHKFSELRARIFGSIASWKDCWTLQATLAAFHKCSVRTVQRSVHDARELGELVTHFSRPGEIPPGAKEPKPFKWCQRFLPGRGLAGEAKNAAINKARAAWTITKAGLRRTFNAPAPKRNERKTAEQIDAELERRAQLEENSALYQPPPAGKRRMSAAELEAELEAIDRARDGPKT